MRFQHLLENLILRRQNEERKSWLLKKRSRRIGSIIRRRVLKLESQSFKSDQDRRIEQIQIREVKLGHETFWTNSQSGQDVFVQIVFAGMNSGRYLEIGSAWPDRISNTYVLERKFNWTGVSLDLDPLMVHKFREMRENLVIQSDATKIDYKILCKELSVEPIFDYLSVDIDPAYQSYFALKKIIGDGVMFACLTFEHDKYRSGYLVQFASGVLLRSKGYSRVAKDICAKDFGKYEDWWLLNSNFSKRELEEIRKKIRQLRIKFSY